MFEDVGCPSCKKKMGQAVERNSTDDGLKVSFECTNCSHLWDVVF